MAAASSPPPGGSNGRGATVRGSVAVGVIVVAGLAIVLTALAYLHSLPRTVAIGEVLGNLREYDGRSVSVGGRVTETFNVLGLKWYRLEDDTASIIVVTQRGLPEKDQTVRVTGIVKEVFNLGGVNATVLQEPLPPD